jgi:hypothetical protein
MVSPGFGSAQARPVRDLQQHAVMLGEPDIDVEQRAEIGGVLDLRLETVGATLAPRPPTAIRSGRRASVALPGVVAAAQAMSRPPLVRKRPGAAISPSRKALRPMKPATKRSAGFS